MILEKNKNRIELVHLEKLVGNLGLLGDFNTMSIAFIESNDQKVVNTAGSPLSAEVFLNALIIIQKRHPCLRMTLENQKTNNRMFLVALNDCEALTKIQHEVVDLTSLDQSTNVRECLFEHMAKFNEKPFDANVNNLLWRAQLIR
jgi:hypothetical protein